MTVIEIVGSENQQKSLHKLVSPKTPQQRKRERETDFEKNARDLKARKRALQQKSPVLHSV